MEAWVIEDFLRDIKIGSWLCWGDEADAVELLQIQAINRVGSAPDVRRRLATSEEIQDLEERGYVVRLDPSCGDWMLSKGFEDKTWPEIHRDTSLKDVLVLARKKADGICGIFLRPATQVEMKKDDEERAEYQRELAMERARNQRWAKWGGYVGTVIQFAVTIGLAWWSFELSKGQHVAFSLVLLGIAGLSALNILWSLLKFVIYQISFVIGKGFRDGKSEKP
jgi:hypothetical protein